ncbi:MAG TPA: winged helix-turn-helix domain-containing protein, partial [Opitutaceae bacterium]
SAWSGKLTPREKEFAGRIMERFETEGALGPEAFADDRRGRRVWGTATLAKATLQKLFFHGRLLIVGRQSNRRLYDLPSRVLPQGILAKPQASAEETARWLALTRLRQHRLVALKRAELALVEDLVQPVAIDGCPVLHCLATDLHWFEPAEGPADAEPLLLAPLDPMIYDRKVTRGLWNFDYTWEAYTPSSKRKRGYYALPILSGMELVGHVDMKADREAKRLGMVSRKVRSGHKTGPAVARLARFLGLRL